MHFNGITTINATDNVYPTGTSQDDINNMFVGGLMSGQSSFGLPEKEMYMSQDRNGNGTISTTSEMGVAVRL